MIENKKAFSAFITGASRGLGWQVGRQLSRSSYHVYFGTRDLSLHGQPVNLEDAASPSHWVHIDINDSNSIKNAYQFIQDKGNKLDVLINNAAINIDDNSPITSIDRQILRDTFETNVFGQIATTQQFLPLLKASDKARILNLSSGCGQLDCMPENLPAYSLSKLTVHGMTLMLAANLKEHNISVNSVCPGWARTKMGGEEAPLSAEEGAIGITWLARDADPAITGKFYRDKKEIPW